jgi:DNA polymerase-3 subunit delta
MWTLPAHVLHGDTYLVQRERSRVESDAGAADVLESNRHRLTGSQTNLNELLSICNALPFMDSFRIVVVDGLLATFERRAGRGRRRNTSAEAGGGSLRGWEGLDEAITAMPDTTLLMFLDATLPDSNPMLRLLRQTAEIHGLPTPSGEALARWIKAAVEEKGSSISPSAIGSMTDMAGGDLWSLDNELEKLSLYAAGERIEESHVKELVNQAREGNVFAAVDAMIDGKQSVALGLLHQLRQDGREAPYIIAMVERQLRLLALARDSIDQGIPQREVGSRLGTTSQFVVRKTMEQAKRHSWSDIIWRYQRLLETDLAIKQGRLEPDLALELLAADQADRGRS